VRFSNPHPLFKEAIAIYHLPYLTPPSENSLDQESGQPRVADLEAIERVKAS
jgi:hypothetical protein